MLTIVNLIELGRSRPSITMVWRGASKYAKQGDIVILAKILAVVLRVVKTPCRPRSVRSCQRLKLRAIGPSITGSFEPYEIPTMRLHELRRKVQ